MPFRKSFNGTFATISATTSGYPLPEVNRIVTSVVKERGNSVKLSWDPPKDSRKATWTYGIYYGVDTDMLFEMPRLNTTNLTATVANLHSCEHYYFSVALVGPYGYGPVRDPLVVTTSFNPKAPPKWPRVDRDPTDPLAFFVRWLPSCSNAGKEIGYIVSMIVYFMLRDMFQCFITIIEIVVQASVFGSSNGIYMFFVHNFI